MGNRLSKTDTAGTTTTTAGYTYDAANRLTGTAKNGGAASAVTSDADGNTLTDTSGRTMTWDSQNRMTSCAFNGTTSTFKYGADGLRRQSVVNGVTTDYVYDGQTLIREGFASSGTLSTLKATYLTGPRGSECRIDETSQTEGYYHYDASGNALKNAQGQPIVYARGVTKWYVYDGLGSVVGEADINGNLTSSPKYDVYGLVRANPGTASSAMGFVGGLGHLSEAGTGLIYMRAWYYDPSLGRFSSQDPEKSGQNWFAYCNNDPVNMIDPTGKDPVLYMTTVVAVLMAWGVLADSSQIKAIALALDGVATTIAGILAMAKGLKMAGEINEEEGNAEGSYQEASANVLAGNVGFILGPALAVHEIQEVIALDMVENPDAP